jgi:hypothetical protein
MSYRPQLFALYCAVTVQNVSQFEIELELADIQ